MAIDPKALDDLQMKALESQTELMLIGRLAVRQPNHPHPGHHSPT